MYNTGTMETNVAEMTVSELRALIADVVEEKLAKFVSESGETDIREELRLRLAEQKNQVDRGERGIPMDDVQRDLGLS